MRTWTLAVLPFAPLIAVFTHAQTTQSPKKGDEPRPGARGNAGNVPYIGKSNPVRLAKATGHMSNYSEDKVPAYTLPDPLVTAAARRSPLPRNDVVAARTRTISARDRRRCW